MGTEAETPTGRLVEWVLSELKLPGQKQSDWMEQVRAVYKIRDTEEIIIGESSPDFAFADIFFRFGETFVCLRHRSCRPWSCSSARIIRNA